MNRGRAFYHDVVLLALPILLQNLCTTLLGLVDTFMVGALGEAPLAAVQVANTPVFVIQLVIFGLQSGSSVLISQFWGKKDIDAINRVIGIGCYVAGAIAALFAAIMCFYSPRQTVCPSCIKTSVCTAYHICVIHISVLLNLFYHSSHSHM